MSKAGGHGSGTIKYPAYMQDQHELWLDNVAALITGAQAAPSPYNGAVAYDPDDYLDNIETEFALVKNDIDGLEPIADWEDMYTNAKSYTDALYSEPTLRNLLNSVGDSIKTRVESLLGSGTTTVLSAVVTAIQEAVEQSISNTSINTAVTAFEKRSRGDMLVAIGRYSGAMYDIGAVNVTGFAIGNALLEAEHLRNVNDYKAKLEMDNRNVVTQYFVTLYNSLLDSYIRANLVMRGEDIAQLMTNKKDRQMLLLQAIDTMTKTMLSKSSLLGDKLSRRVEAARVGILAKTEQTNKDLELDIMDSKWDFDVLMYGGNVLGSIAGAAHNVDRPMSTGQSMLSGALSGAGAGAALGPWGAAGGAVAGAIAGYFI